MAKFRHTLCTIITLIEVLPKLWTGMNISTIKFQHSNARVKIQLLFLFCATRRQKTLFHFSLLRRLKASIKVYDEQEEHVFVDSGTNSNVV